MRLMLLLVGILMTNVCYASEATDRMAKILISFNHFPADEDLARLEAILEDNNSSDNEKALAGIISRVAHKPAESDRSALDALGKGRSTPAVKTLAKAVMSINHTPSAESITALKAMLEP